MELQNEPSKIARLSDHEMRTVEGSSQNGLGLSLGLGRAEPGHGSSKSSGFTFLQLRELEHQALIYNYIEAGVPVPFHLILPVWKSVASSFTALNLLGCSTLYHDYRNSMEPEPGRCRRTDGKKWRCSKDVVPNHKYCEKHINRGRRRSSPQIDHVEAAAISTSSSHSTNR